MKTPLALYNLLHQGAKTLVSIGGVAFALLLVFMQLGFMGAVSTTATNVLEQLQFDLLIRGRDYVHLYEPSRIERELLVEANNVSGVASTAPLWLTVHNWRTLATAEDIASGEVDHQYLPIAVIAFEPQDDVFRTESIATQQQRLQSAQHLLLDDSTQASYGAWNGRRFTSADIDRETEVGGQAFQISGLFQLGTGLAANGAMLVGRDAFAGISPFDTQSTCSLGLVRTTDPALAQVDLVQQRLQARFSLGRVDVLTRSEAFDRERYRWLWQTPIGLIFQLGVVLSLLVGSAIVYMVLSTDVANRLPEYATLLAMGYSRGYLASIVMTQALVLCGLGFVAAWGAAEALYRLTSAFSSIPLGMTPTRVVIVGMLGAVMCCVSGLFALRKLWKAEPASLF